MEDCNPNIQQEQTWKTENLSSIFFFYWNCENRGQTCFLWLDMFPSASGLWEHKSQPYPSSPLSPMPVLTTSLLHFTESDSSECNLEEVMETLINELQCCTSRNSMHITDVIYMRIFYVKDVLDHWRAQNFVHVCLEKVTTCAPAVSLTPVDGLEKENTFMLVSCLLQKTKEGIQEWLSVNPSRPKRDQHQNNT